MFGYLRNISAKMFVCLFSPVVLARPAQAGDIEELYEKGVVLFENELYSEASQAFRQVHELNPNYRYLFNIGRCELALKRYNLALEAFVAYLAGGGNQISSWKSPVCKRKMSWQT